MIRILLIIIISIVVFTSCKQNKSINILLQDFSTPYNIPPFEKIKPTDFIEAYKTAIKEHKDELAAITDNNEKPNFSNTILALDNSGIRLNNLDYLFSELYLENLYTEQLDSISDIVYAMYDNHFNSIYSDSLVKRIEVVYKERAGAKLSDLELRVLDKYYSQLKYNGTYLNGKKSKQYLQLNAKIAELEGNFSQNLRNETGKNKLITIFDSSKLHGVPESLIIDAKSLAKHNEKPRAFQFIPNRSSCISILESATNREFREQVFNFFYNRCNFNDEWDNNKNVKSIVNYRLQLAKTFGYENYFEFTLKDKLENNSDSIYRILNLILQPSVKQANVQLQEMKKLLISDLGRTNFEPWDWWYYAKKLKEKKFKINTKEIENYFSLNNCMFGVTTLINELYNISFNKRDDLPVFNEHVVSYELCNEKGKVISVVYFDPYYRENKEDVSRCTIIRNGNNDSEIPILIVTLNLTKPKQNHPCLLSPEQVKVVFHEFGHALNLSLDNSKYAALSLDAPMDCIELPSTIMEYWAFEKDLLKLYAKHYKTEESIDLRLIDKIVEQCNYNKAFEMVEYLGASFLDLAYHSIYDSITVAPERFETELFKNIGLPKEIYPRYKSTNFRHAFGSHSVFASGYYTYMYSDLLAAHSFDIFKRSGNIFNQEVAERFKKYCLTEFGQDEAMMQYLKFSDEKPKVNFFLDYYGLTNNAL